ncbi:UNVERIFIED_CONTAM: hypothetical protein PYX00_004981 [Menopon gallinae]|uniref:Uncharacterized protein n=1 Tax=Menopon gallinae TaxID=328185 RepID=A0AAW2I7U2_9NEOP
MDFTQLLESKSTKEKPKHSPVLIAIGKAFGITAVVLSALSFPFIMPAFRRVPLPYVPATPKQVENVLEALKGKSGKVIDLGSGDGRIVMAAARNGFHSTGIELNVVLVIYSKLVSLFSGLQNKPKFYLRNIFKFNLKPYRNVVIFGVDSMMEQLKIKFSQELLEGTHIIACRFPLPGKTPIQTIGSGIDTVWVYKY